MGVTGRPSLIKDLFVSALIPRIALIITTSVASCIFLARTLVFVTNNNPDNPFVVYESILPGNSKDALDMFECHLVPQRVNGLKVGSRAWCAFFPKDGIFDIVHVDVVGNTIVNATFYAINMREGDITLWLGRNSMRLSLSSASQLYWEQERFVVKTAARPFHFYDRVRILYFSLNIAL